MACDIANGTLTNDEEMAIKRYVSSNAYKLNYGLQNSELTTEQFQAINQLDRALEKCQKRW